jgi:hypothetical protein
MIELTPDWAFSHDSATRWRSGSQYEDVWLHDYTEVHHSFIHRESR